MLLDLHVSWRRLRMIVTSLPLVSNEPHKQLILLSQQMSKLCLMLQIIVKYKINTVTTTLEIDRRCLPSTVRPTVQSAYLAFDEVLVGCVRISIHTTDIGYISNLNPHMKEDQVELAKENLNCTVRTT